MMSHDGTLAALAFTSAGWNQRVEQEDVSAGQPINCGDKASAGASETATWSISASRHWLACIAAFKVAAAAGVSLPVVAETVSLAEALD
jgi:hypothetical protein